MAYRNNDIERYLRGELTPAEMHALEQKALRDPFLAEALEGAEHAGPKHFTMDLNLLQRSIHEKTRKKPKILSLNGWPLYLGIAAGLLILAVSSFVILTMIKQQDRANEIAVLEKRIATDTVSTVKDSAAPETTAAETEEKAEETKPAVSKEQSRVSQRAENPNTTAQVTSPVADSSVAAFHYADAAESDIAVAEAELRDTVGTLNQGVVAGVETRRAKVNDEIRGGEIRSTREAKIHLNLDRAVKGKVVAAEDGSPLAGVNVLIKGTNKGTITGTDGFFSLELPTGNDSLVFSFIGLASKEVKANQEQIQVAMESDVSQLSEMVVAGEGADDEADKASGVIEMAEPQGGRNAFKRYLEEQLQYPEQALENQVRGKVTVQFTVQPNGQLSDFQILKGLGYGCDEEVIRLIKEGPSWVPSKKNNRPVKEKVKIRLNFNLPEKK